MATLRGSSAGRTLSTALARSDARILLGLLLAVIAVGINVTFWRSSRSTAALVVARHDIALGSVLTPGDLSVTHARLEGPLATLAIPSEQVGRVVGQTAVRAIHAGDLVESADLGSGPVLGAGEAAVTVPVDPASVYPHLAPGDLVSVIGTSGRQTPQSQTVTVLKQAVVYDIGAQPIGTGVAPAGGPQGSRLLNVTLIVPDTDAEALAHALVDWQVTLVLLPRQDAAPHAGSQG